MKVESNLEAAPLRYAGVATLLRRPFVNDPSLKYHHLLTPLEILPLLVPHCCMRLRVFWRMRSPEKKARKRMPNKEGVIYNERISGLLTSGKNR